METPNWESEEADVMVFRKPARIWCMKSQMGFLYLLKFTEEEYWSPPFGLSFDRFWFQYQVSNGFRKLMAENPLIIHTNILGIRVVDFYPMREFERDILMSRFGDYLYHIGQEVGRDD